MTESSLALDQEAKRYPLSFMQEWFITLDQGDDAGAFGRRFILVCPIRVTGTVDLAVLQGALDDVVARHELLRTVVVRDADPPYQLVYPPCQVPLEIRDLPPVTGKSPDMVVQELIVEFEEASTINTREVPLLWAELCRFDDRDSVLFLAVHHSVSDAWSVEVTIRDLGAFYAARSSGIPAKLPEVQQYHEYSEWQKANVADSGDDGAPKYWLEKLNGAREFTMPNDHGHPDTYSRPYSLHVHAIGADVISEAAALATAARSTVFTVFLSAFYVLAHKLTGATDLAIRAFTAGRNDEQFHNTMGLFINVVPFRTDLSDCASFRDIVMQTRETFVDSIAHELPVNVIEQTFPDFTKSREDLRTSQFIIASLQSQFGEYTIPIAEGAHQVEERLLEEPEHHDIPSGMVWNVGVTSAGELSGGVLFNRDEFDESTVEDLTASLRQILTSAVSEPDRDWRLL
jgi:condensation enzyme